ncbi:MAG: flavodoxin family protein [Eubacterium sp.]|jgi:multimeric flavodoxin WrbA|nr:flavodoxin family protein [Eubacterium sp.]
MKVIAINASPNENGNTAYAVNTIAGVLKENNIETEIINIGKLALRGCVGCGKCGELGRCVFNDEVNEITPKMAEADGLIIGSPVYYAGINGTLKSFLDRAFFSKSKAFRLKPCAAVVAARRAGTTSALQSINFYIEFAEMINVPTTYWSGVFGNNGGDTKNDLEGMQILRQLGKNMAYIMKLKENSSIPLPEKDQREWYSFIR